MNHGEDIRMGVRWIIGRPVETLLLVFGISLGIGATAAGIALAGRTGAEARRILASTEYREIVVRARQSASEMDLPAVLQTDAAAIILTSADLAAREDAQDVQYAYVANPTGFRFGATEPMGGAPPPEGQVAEGATAAPGGTQAAAGGQAAPVAGAGRLGGAAQLFAQPGIQLTEAQRAERQRMLSQWQAEQVKAPEGPQPVIEEARGWEVSPEFFDAWDMAAAQGSLFTVEDIRKSEPVMVLGSTIATTLFEDGQSLGRQLLARNQLYRVIGILAPTGTEHDTSIFTTASMPELAGMEVVARFRGFNTNLHFTVTDYTKLERAKAQLESWFEQKYGEGSAVITIPRYQAEATKDRNTRLVTVILFLALAALVIAAANVTNILFARALRKRRSVGILKALGATSRGVFQLFFLEAAIIGVAGAAVGTGLSVLMSKLMQDTMGFGSIYVSLLAAGIIGSAALVTALDIFPAMQAARVPAAEAIRYE